MTAPFWKIKALEEMTRDEWESLCDGCGRCCLHKLRDEDTQALAFTNVACRLLNLTTCRCADYERRQRWVPDCVALTPATVREIDWLPPSCAYRRIAEGKGLAWWHPLVSGDPETVHTAGISVRGRAISEREAGALEDHVESWPGRNPRARRPETEIACGGTPKRVNLALNTKTEIACGGTPKRVNLALKTKTLKEPAA